MPILLGILLLLGLGIPSRAEEFAKPTCAVLTLEARQNVTAGDTVILTDRLAGELTALGQYRLMPRGQMGEILKAQEFSRSENCSAATCAVEAGKLLAIQYIVYGSVGKLGDTYAVNLSMADVESGAAERSANYDHEGRIDDLLRGGMAIAARRLAGLTDEPPPGGARPSRQVGRPGPSSTADNRVAMKPRPIPGLSLDLGGGVSMDFVWIEPGTFQIGSPPGEMGRDSDETQHQVTLTQGFWMAMHEVTQEQWERVMGQNSSRFRGPRNPVDTVRWEKCQEFLGKMNQRSDFRNQMAGGRVRLPTEAEWEYACRAGTTGQYAGNLDTMGWYYENSRGTSQPVGEKEPNAWGLYDMHGNVWEWCQDWYEEYSGNSVTDPTGPDHGRFHVVRGGGWSGLAEVNRCAYRDWVHPRSECTGVGLRVVIAP